MKTLSQAELELAAQIAEFYDDMLGAALFLFPWGKGALAGFTGPNKYQERFLIDLSDEIKARRFDGRNAVRPIRMSISSGHGTGKTAMIGMLSGVLMSTRPGLLGTVTANTGQQLSTKTWASIQTWHSRLINKHWFEINAERFYRIGRKSDWFMSPQSCAEENSEAFAGQHNLTSSSVYMFDEDSNVPDKIHEVAEGGLTDGEPMIFTFGNPTRRSGSFYQINFGQRRDFWNRCTLGASRLSEHPAGTRVWNSEESDLSNKEQIAEWAEEWGVDSDFYRVRVQGLPPNAGDAQFISAELITAAQRRVPRALPDDPLIAGCDLSWGGDDKNTVRFRRGHDAKSIKPIYVPGELSRDPGVMVMKLSEVLSTTYDGRKVDMLFLDSAGICGPIARRLRELGYKNLIEVNFGAHSMDAKYFLQRSYMWGQLRDWLQQGAIDKSLDLEADLAAPGYSMTRDTKILLEPKDKIKKRLEHSTDDGDALALTFAMPVRSKQHEEQMRKKRVAAQGYVGAFT